MKKITFSKLFVASLVLVLAVVLPMSFAKAEDTEGSDDGINKTEVNKDRSDMNKNPGYGQDNNPGDDNDNDNNGGDGDNDDGQLTGQEHMSAVAEFVQNLLDTADREKGGIGEEVRAIAQEQNDDKEEVAREIDEVNNRSGFKTFFIGTDYKNLGNLRSAIAKTQTQIDRLTRLLETATGTTKTDIEDQIQALKDQQDKINNFIDDNEGKFSLFGWFVKLFQ
jgi:hypothetical protein